MTMRDMSRDIETPEQARAMVITAGPAAAHMALMIIERVRIRQELDAEAPGWSGPLERSDQALVDACIEAWKSIYAFRGI
jgi:hypothetical protein